MMICEKKKEEEEENDDELPGFRDTG